MQSFLGRPGERLDNWSRIIGLLAILLALCLLQGCSAVKLGYNNAPYLAYWWLDGYADLSETQSRKLREDLTGLHQWHRVNELPKIAELLEKTRQLAAGPLNAEQVCGLFTEARVRVDALVARAEPAGVALAMSLSAAQLGHIETKFAKTNAEWREDWKDGSLVKRQAKRLKAAVERSEQFYGTLEERQIAVLRDAIAHSGFDQKFSYAERLRRQQDLLRTLRQTSAISSDGKSGVPQATAALRAYMERALHSPDPAYQAYQEKEIADNCATMAQLHNSATAEQRERAIRRLAAYERDAREVASQH